MSSASRPSRQKSWQTSRERVSVLAALAIQKETVSRKLAQLREAHAGPDGKALSQEKAAQRVGVTMRQWQRWEGGNSLPYPRNLGAIADSFGFEVGEFYTEDEPSSTNSHGQQPTLLERIEQKLDRQYVILGDILAAIGEPDGLEKLSRAGRELRALGQERAQARSERPEGPGESDARPAGG